MKPLIYRENRTFGFFVFPDNVCCNGDRDFLLTAKAAVKYCPIARACMYKTKFYCQSGDQNHIYV